MTETPIGLGRKILVVEDDKYLAALLAQVLSDNGFNVQVAHDASAGYETALQFDPDQALIDVMLGEGPTGVDLTYSLTAKMPWVALVLVTHVKDLAAAGLPDPAPGTGLVHKNQVTDVKVLLDIMQASLAGDDAPTLTATSPFRELTRGQIAVLRMMAQGYSNDAIARMRDCSRSAVEYQVSAIFRALGVNDLPDVSRRAEVVRIFVNAVGPVQRAQQ